MNRRIAFFDIDGTLIHMKNNLTRPTRETIQSLITFQLNGNYIVAASARGTLPECLNEIPFDGVILSDGHYIEFHDNTLVDNLFSSEEVNSLVELFKRYTNGYVFGGYHGKWISSYTSSSVISLEKEFGTPDSFLSTPLVKELEEIKANSCTPLFDTIEDLSLCLAELNPDWSINKYLTGLLRMDIHRSGFTKGSACQFLMDHLGIDRNNGYAFGDGSNDIEMLTLIQNSVAMGNADLNIKNVARYVTLSVDDNGVSHFLDKINKGESIY